MRKSFIVLLATVCSLLFSAVAVADAEAAKVLVFSGTTGYRHEGGDQGIRTDAITMIRNQLAARGMESDYRTCNGMTTTLNNGTLVDGSSPTTGTPAGCRNAAVGVPSLFTAANLAQYDAIFLYQASSKARGADGNVNYLFNADEKAAFQAYAEAGGGIAVGHGASSFGTDASVWPWFDAAGGNNSLVGATMPGHGPTDINIRAGVQVADPNHPSTKDLPEMYLFGDEHYTWSNSVRGNKHVLMTLDRYNSMPGSNYTTTPTPSGHVPANMGADHPLSWCAMYSGTRTWVTGMGHFASSYVENGGNNNLMKHIIGGVAWAAGLEGNDSDCGGTVWSNYERTVLSANVRGPIGLDIAKDGKVYWTEIGPWGTAGDLNRTGQIKVFNPDNNQTSTVHTIETWAGYASSNHGVLGMALDPNFETNKYLYVYYSARNGSTPNNTFREGYNLVSRFTINAAGTGIVAGSEQEILRVPAIRIGDNNRDGTNEDANSNTAHQGGALSFDSEGNLYLGTGDDVDPRGTSQNYVPMDQRFNGRYDARLTSANTNDLQGKILRIKPRPNASGAAGIGTTYDIPAGNMFTASAQTRPEIYAMGMRNPFTVHADPEIPGRVVVGEYAHDASSNSATRGTAGIIEWLTITEPGFHGWPYCMGDNATANSALRYTWPSGPAGAVYDCSAAQIPNDSPFNDGLANIPGPAKPATLWKKYGDSQPARFGPLGGGMDPITGPIYRYNEQNQSATRWPAYWDGSWLFANMGSTWKEARVSPTTNTLISTYPIFGLTALGGTNQNTYASKFGPDGSLYFVRWDSNCCRTNLNVGTHQLVKIDFTANDCTSDDEDPVVTPAVSGTPAGSGNYANQATLTLTATDLGCAGVSNNDIEYSTTGAAGTYLPYNPNNKPTFGIGNHTVHYRATDNFGNTSAPASVNINVVSIEDNTPPALTVNVTGTPAGENIYSGSASVTASATDDSGIGPIEYRVNSGSWTNYTAALTFNTPGARVVDFRVSDLSSNANQSTTSRTFSVIAAGTCQPVMSDEFDTAGAYNAGRWSYRWGGNNTPPALPTVSGGNLNFQIGSWAVDIDRTGPIHFLGQPLPSGDFTMSAKISAPNLNTDATSTGTLQYAQAGIMIYQDDNHWAKVDRTRNADGNATTHTQFESATETGGTRQLGTRTPANPGLAATTDPPGNFWGIRLTSSGGNLSGQYSLNPDAGSPTWTTIPWPAGGGGASLNGIMPTANGPRYIGLFGGSGSTVTQVDWVRVTPDGTGECEDTTPPTALVSVNPASPDGSNGWYRTAPTVTVTGIDDTSAAGNIDLEYRIGSSAAWQPYNAPVTLTAQGVSEFQARATDEADNVSDVVTRTIELDSVNPTVSHGIDPATGPYFQPTVVTLTLTGSDATSGVGSIQYNTGSGWQNYNPASKPQFSAIGSYSISYRATDNAGNVSAENSLSFDIDEEVVTPDPAALKISGKKKVTFKGKKAGKVKLTIANTGGTDATTVKICVKVPKSKVKTKKCINLGTIAPGARKSKSLSFKAQKKFIGKKFSAKAKVTVTAKSGSSTVKTNYDVKLNKRV